MGERYEVGELIRVDGDHDREIKGHQGSPMAAINVAVSTAQCSMERLVSEVGPRVAQAAESITVELGYRPAPHAVSA